MEKGKGPCQIDPDLWYTEMPRGKPTIAIVSATAEKVKKAISICDTCPVRLQCNVEGMRPENLTYGIWAGKMAGERLVEAGYQMQDFAKDSDEWEAMNFMIRMIPWVRWT